MLRVTNLVGFGGLILPTLEHFASATSSAPTITIPAGVDTTDVAVLWDCVGYDNPSPAVPSGWTQLAAGALTGRGNLVVSYKALSASDASQSITGMNGADTEQKRMEVFRLDREITSVNASTFNEQTTTSNPSPQTVNVSGATAPLIVIGGSVNDGSLGSSTLTSDVGFDALYEFQYGAGDWFGAGYAIQNSSLVNHSIDMSDGGNNYLCSGYLEIS